MTWNFHFTFLGVFSFAYHFRILLTTSSWYPGDMSSTTTAAVVSPGTMLFLSEAWTMAFPGRTSCMVVVRASVMKTLVRGYSIRLPPAGKVIGTS